MGGEGHGAPAGPVQMPSALQGQQGVKQLMEADADVTPDTTQVVGIFPMVQNGATVVNEAASLRAAHNVVAAWDNLSYEIRELRATLCKDGTTSRARAGLHLPGVGCRSREPPAQNGLDPQLVGSSISTDTWMRDIKVEGFEQCGDIFQDWLEDGTLTMVTDFDEQDGPRANSAEDAAANKGVPHLAQPVVLQVDFDFDDEQSSRHLEQTDSPSCTPLLRQCSDGTFCQPGQTLIIFDWDDTLCPSSICMERYGLSSAGQVPQGELAVALEELAQKAKALVERAGELAAEVVIVTNAGPGWVESTCANWMPGLREALRPLTVVSARARWEPRGVSSPTGWKAREFEHVIQRFYSQSNSQTWKNVVAVGDAPYEHEALQRVMQQAPWRCTRTCRSKSVRFVAKPSIQQLKYQLQTLCDVLEDVVRYDGDLDIQIPADCLPVE